MDKVKELARRAWAKYRGWPLWGQIAAGVVLVSVIAGPILEAGDSETGDGVAPATTDVAVETSTADTNEGTTSPTTTEGATTTTTEAATTTTLAATTTTISEEERVSGALADNLQGGDLISVVLPDGLISDDQVSVTVAGSDGLTDGLTKDAARLAVATTLEALVDANLDPATTRFRVVVTFDLVNNFGEVTNTPVIDVVYDRAVAERIQFDNIDFRQILTLPTLALTIHPTFEKGDGS